MYLVIDFAKCINIPEIATEVDASINDWTLMTVETFLRQSCLSINNLLMKQYLSSVAICENIFHHKLHDDIEMSIELHKRLITMDEKFFLNHKKIHAYIDNKELDPKNKLLDYLKNDEEDCLDWTIIHLDYNREKRSHVTISI